MALQQTIVIPKTSPQVKAAQPNMPQPPPPPPSKRQPKSQAQKPPPPPPPKAKRRPRPGAASSVARAGQEPRPKPKARSNPVYITVSGRLYLGSKRQAKAKPFKSKRKQQTIPNTVNIRVPHGNN